MKPLYAQFVEISNAAVQELGKNSFHFLRRMFSLRLK